MKLKEALKKAGQDVGDVKTAGNGRYNFCYYEPIMGMWTDSHPHPRKLSFIDRKIEIIERAIKLLGYEPEEDIRFELLKHHSDGLTTKPAIEWLRHFKGVIDATNKARGV